MRVKPEEKTYYTKLGQAIRTVRVQRGESLSQHHFSTGCIERGQTWNYTENNLNNLIRTLGFDSAEALLQKAEQINIQAAAAAEQNQADAVTLGRAIRKIRIHRNKLQTDIAKEASVGPTCISDIETGHRDLYSKETLEKVIRILGFKNAEALLKTSEELSNPQKAGVPRAPTITPKDEVHAKELGKAICEVRRTLQKKPADIGDKTIVGHIEAGRVGKYTPEQLLEVIQSLGYANEADILAAAKIIKARFERIMAELREELSREPGNLQNLHGEKKAHKRGE